MNRKTPTAVLHYIRKLAAKGFCFLDIRRLYPNAQPADVHKAIEAARNGDLRK